MDQEIAKKLPDSEPYQQTYTIRSGTVNKGNTYEFKLATLFSLASLTSSKVTGLDLAMNTSGCGDFDDLIIRTTTKGKQTTFLLQIKHQETPQDIKYRDFFTESKGNFALKTYAKVIIPEAKNNEYVIKHLNAQDDLVFVLFTNRGVTESCDFLTSTVSPIDFFNTCDGGKVYTFCSEKIEAQCINHGFLNKLFLFSNQVHVDEIDKIIRKQIKSLIKESMSELVLDEIIKQYVSFIISWAQGELGGFYFLTKEHVANKLSELFLNSYTNRFYDSTPVNRTNYNLDLWHKITKDKNIILLEGYDNFNVENFIHSLMRQRISTYCGEQSLKDTKSSWEKISVSKSILYKSQAIKNEMLRSLGHAANATLLHLYKTLWKLEELPLIINCYDKRELQIILNVLKMTSFRLKALVILKNPIEEIPKLKEDAKAFCKLLDLHKKSTELLSILTIKLQGKSLHLKNLVDLDPSLEASISSKDIMKLVSGALTIGEPLKVLPDYYIKRTIPRILIDFKALGECVHDEFIIRCNSTISFLICLQKREISIEHLDIIEFDPTGKKSGRILLITPDKDANFVREESASNKTVHYLTFYNDEALEWNRTCGSISDIRTHRRGDSLGSIETSNAHTHFTNQVNILAAAPGMGKSVLLDYLATSTPPDKWVIKINLNQDIKLREALGMDINDALQNLGAFSQATGDNNTLSKSVFKRFFKSKKVLFLLDEFDEVPEASRDKVMEMVMKLHQTGCPIWMVTRPVLQEYLEIKFNTVALDINTFTSEDQVEFLNKYFANINHIPGKDLTHVRDFVDQLLSLTKANLNPKDGDIIGVPLQTKLLAEAFNEECKEYIETHSFSVDKNFDLLDLYEKYFTRNICSMASKIGNSMKISKAQLGEYQEYSALQVLFSKEDLSGLDLSRYSFMDNPPAPSIVQPGEMNFTHRTVAEYFAAKWLSTNIDNENYKETVDKLSEKVFRGQSNTLRQMLDKFVSRSCNVVMKATEDVVKGVTNKDIVENEAIQEELTNVKDVSEMLVDELKEHAKELECVVRNNIKEIKNRDDFRKFWRNPGKLFEKL